MVLFRTKFMLSKDMTRDDFLSILSSCLKKSGDYSFSFDYDNEDEYLVESEDGSERLMLYQDETRLAVQVTKKDDFAVYIHTYIMVDSDGPHVMFVELSRLSVQATINQEVHVSVPQLMREIFWREYGGVDFDIMTDDKGFIIRKHNIEIAKKIVTHEVSYLNPIVYVSPEQSTGKYRLDYTQLASDLIGVAHVVVEGSPYVSQLIQESTKGANPYDGGVSVFLPNGESYGFSDADGVLSNGLVFNYVRSITASVVVSDDFSFQKIRFEHLLAKAGENSELSSLCDEILADKEQELQIVKEELSKTKSDLLNAQSHIASLQAAFDKTELSDKSVPFVVTEDDMYDGEIRDVVLKVLQKERDAMSDDANLKSSRKYTVISDILANNERTGTDDMIRTVFRENLKNGTFNTEEIRNLERLGFSIVREANRHFKVAYHGDNRYQTTVSSSPSDCRAGNNLVSTYMNMLFGY